MSGYEISDSINLKQRIGYVDGKCTKLGTSVARVDSEISDLRNAVENLNEITAALRVQVSNLRRSPIPDSVLDPPPDKVLTRGYR